MESDDINTDEKPIAGWYFKLGSALFGLSIIMPLAGIPLLAAFKLSAGLTTSISAALLVGSEVIGVAAIAVMGKSGFAFIKNRVFCFVKQYGPPNTVSRSRYTVGLVMFAIPVLFAWISIYAADIIPYYENNKMTFALGGDLLFLTSFFVLGGDFWDKVRSLFIYDATVDFS